MTLEEFQRNLELITQIENIKQQRKYNEQQIAIAKANSNNMQKMAPVNVMSDNNDNKKWYQKFFQGSKDWEDGYDFGDVTKTVVGSTADAGLNIYNAVAKSMEGISKLGAQGIAQVADWTGHDKFANAMRKEIADDNNDAYLSPKVEAFKKKYVEPHSILGDTTDSIAEGVGSTIASAAYGAIPGLSPDIGKLKNVPILMGLSSAGQGVTDAYKKDDVQDWQAWLKGGTSGAVESLSESIFGAFGVGGSELDDALVKKATQKMSNAIAKAGVTLGIKAGGESAEEFLSYAGNYLSNKLIDKIGNKTNAKAKFSEKWNWDEVTQSMVTSFISSGITQGPSNFMMANRDIDVTNGRNNSQSEAIKNIAQERATQQADETGKKVKFKDYLNIENQVMQDVDSGKITSEQLQEVLDKINSSRKKPLAPIDNKQLSELRNTIIEQLNDFKNIDENTKNAFINTISGIQNASQLKEMNATLNEMLEAENNTSILQSKNEQTTQNISITKLTRQEITQNYGKYKNTQLNQEVVNNALNSVPANRRGNRSINDWLKVAEQIGINTDSSQAEAVAWKTWMELQPFKSKTSDSGRYFAPEKWINAVVNASNNAQKNENIVQNSQNVVENAQNNTISVKEAVGNVNINDKLEELRKIDTSEMGLLEKSKIKREIRALEAGYTNIDDYQNAENERIEKAKREAQNKKMNIYSKEVESNSYKMQHRPTKNGVGYDITSTQSIGKDIYINPENYVDMSIKYNQESYKSLLSIKDKPNAEVTIYRASPKNELNEGDWITLSKTYAEMEAQKENVTVNEFKVKAKDIQFAGDDINEFGYFPTENTTNNIKRTLISRKSKIKNNIPISTDTNVDKSNIMLYNDKGIKLGKKEYEQVGSIINTNFPNMKINEEFAKEVGDYLYIGEKVDEGEFTYFAKIQIESNEDLIDIIKGDLKNGINKTSKDAIGLLKKYKNERGIDNSNNDSGKTARENRQTNRLYSRQSQDDNIKSNTSQSIGNQSRELVSTSSFFELKTDNKGRRLTTENVQKLKGTKIRDNEGNVITVYHGSPNGDIIQIKGGSYFTEDINYAKRYANQNISNKKISDSEIYECYLDIKKPFDISDETAKKIYINDYIKGGNAVGINPYESDEYYNKISTIDWTEADDLKDFLINNSYDYDGIIVDEGADGGYGEDVVSRGKSYLTFNDEQAIIIGKNSSSINAEDGNTAKKQAPTPEDFKAKENAPVKVNEYNGYTNKEIENISSDKITIANDNNDILDFVKNAKQQTNNKRIFVSKILSSVAKKIKNKLGINVENYNISIKNDDIRKIFKDHGTEKTEILRGQVPITDSDFLLVREVVNNPDSIELAGKTAQGKDAIRFEKDISGNLVIITYVSDKHRNLELQTMYKFKNNKKMESATVLHENKAPELNTSKITGSSTTPINNIIPSEQNYVNNTKKTLNPTEIANLTEENASSIPKITAKSYENGNKQSSFYKNITNNSKFLNSDLRSELKTQEDIKYYKGVTNEESLTTALNRLNNGGEIETLRWLNKQDDFKPEDVTEGWILLKRYQDIGDYDSAVEVAKKMRNIGTTGGQIIQLFNIMSRLTPEGMTKYAQQELSEAFEKFSKNKTKEWILENQDRFNLTAEEQKLIIKNVQDAQKLEDNSREKKIKLAEIQAMMNNKLPPERGAGIKAWMRISMLFNSKTQVRNVMGNALIVPVNMVGDVFSSFADRYIASKTGVRTIGTTNIKKYISGIKKGVYESYDDFKRGINTRNVEGNRFELGEGKSFNDKNTIGKALNFTDNLLSFMLDAGDRGFYEASFVNSINNQLELNHTKDVTQEMIDIATSEALSRTWQDNNEYTKFVLSIRKAFNKINIHGYGLGDVLIPFAKTPANLTKAIVDYSPVGLVKSIIEGNNLKKAISRGDVTAQQQHKFVQDFGKATAGTILYVIGYALAQLGIITGESDDDKDVANFMKNSLGTSSYSVKIGNKSFTYDWAQPLAAPFGIMANLVQQQKADVNNDTDLLKKAIDLVDLPVNMILEQSFMQSIQEVLNNNGGVVQGVVQQVLDLPARAIPTLSKQIVDLTDSTQRQTYVKGDMLATARNKVFAKIPFASKMLAPTVDTLGNEVQKYGGKNSIFNVLFNPANVNSENISESGVEIYKIYKETGDKSIFPKTADYSLTYEGKKYNLSPQDRTTYQGTMGKYINSTVSKLLDSKDYQELTSEDKAKLIKEIVSDGNEIAKLEYANKNNIKYKRTTTDIDVDNEIKDGLNVANAYLYKSQIKEIKGEKDSKGKTITGTTTNNKIKYIMNMDISDTQKQHLVNLLADDTDYNLNINDLNKLDGDYLTYIQQSGKVSEGSNQLYFVNGKIVSIPGSSNGKVSAREKYMGYINAGIKVQELNKFYELRQNISGLKDVYGKTMSGSQKKALFTMVNSLKLNVPQKMILLASQYESFGKLYYKQIIKYLETLNISNKEKARIIRATLL